MNKMNDASMKNYMYSLAEGIRRSPEFEKKGLAQYAINVGLRYGHDCTYCSSRAMLRCHQAFKELGKGMTTTGFSIVDPGIVERVAGTRGRWCSPWPKTANRAGERASRSA